MAYSRVFASLYELEIYPIRNWYINKPDIEIPIYKLEIYPIRNWYDRETSWNTAYLFIRNISYKELIHAFSGRK